MIEAVTLVVGLLIGYAAGMLRTNHVHNSRIANNSYGFMEEIQRLKESEDRLEKECDHLREELKQRMEEEIGEADEREPW